MCEWSLEDLSTSQKIISATPPLSPITLRCNSPGPPEVGPHRQLIHKDSIQTIQIYILYYTGSFQSLLCTIYGTSSFVLP